MAQPSPSMSRILALARDGVRATTGTSLHDVLQSPHLAFLRSFFATWLKLDLTTLASLLTIFGTLSGALRIVQGLALKLYWWFTKIFTASISIAGNDRLNREIVNWLGTQILATSGTRILTARTEMVQNEAFHLRRVTTERNDYLHEKRVPIQYLPTFGTTWFIHQRNIFLVQRIPSTQGNHMSRSMSMPQEYVAAPEGDEPLVIMCLGRSVNPIKEFLNTCRQFAEQQREAFITVRASKSSYHHNLWDTTILRPIRPLATVHFDETTKFELVSDIKNYLDPVTRRFYIARGIPYRRGYLLHGTPGTGKTSLSLALAGYFGLELYLCHLPSVREDNELERLFTALPPRCIVLLEDIDAVGIKRQPDMSNEEEEDDDEKEEKFNPHRSRCTLSGVLNVLDGVASQEGRIVLMTSNHADRLDKALVRPGRIDRMIFLGNISQRSAELMFLRMYAPDHTHESAPADATFELGDGELEKLALEFSSQIPEDTFTPAQLQGYLLNRRALPKAAAVEASVWVEEENATMEDAKARAKEAKAWRAKKRKGASMKPLSRNLATAGLDDDLAQELADLGVEIGGGGAATLRAVVNGRSKGDVKDDTEATAKMETSGELKERAPVDAKEEKRREVDNKMLSDLKEAEPGEVEQDAPIMPKLEINRETKEVLATAREETSSEVKDEVPSIAGDGLAETSQERIKDTAVIETQDR